MARGIVPSVERPGASWARFEHEEPEMAAFAREQFEAGLVIVATVSRDGAPRISFVEPRIVDGVLYLAMLWRSRKALDLQRDSRLALHNPVCTNQGDESELSIVGRVVEIRDPDLRHRFLQMASERSAWREPRFHLFAVDLERVGTIRYDHGEQHVRVWPSGAAFSRPYG